MKGEPMSNTTAKIRALTRLRKAENRLDNAQQQVDRAQTALAEAQSNYGAAKRAVNELEGT